MKKIKLSNFFPTKKLISWLRVSILIILVWMILSLLFNSTIKLSLNASRPIDAYFVLGGSITREIYMAKLAKYKPEIPIIISTGSDEPCIFLIFQRERASMENVWLEQCANSTFENFFFTIPILKNWEVHKVKVITSGTHLKRAKLIAKILLSSQGIALDLEPVKESKGIPANQENILKTSLDVSRSLLWAFFGQLIQPHCNNLINLPDIDLDWWDREGFSCERQGGLRSHPVK